MTGKFPGPAPGEGVSGKKAYGQRSIDNENRCPEAARACQSLPAATDDIIIEQRKNGEDDGQEDENA
jgi:hypothetical protein